MKYTNIAVLLAVLQSSVALADTNPTFYGDAKARSKQQNYNFVKKSDKAKKINIKQKHKKENIQHITPFVVKKINLANNQTDIDFDDLLGSYKGKKLDSKKLQLLIKSINQRLQDNGWILSFAFAPKQDFANNNLDLAIMNGRIRDVKVVSNIDVAKNKLFNEYVDNIINYYPVKNHQLQKDIQLINKIPGYEVQFNLEPINDQNSEIDEIADLVVIVDYKKADLNLMVNNQGSRVIGKTQFFAMGNFNNLFNANESIGLSGVTTNKTSAMKNVNLDVEKFINSHGTSVNLLGSYMEDDPYAVLPGTASSNKSYMFRATLNHYLLLTNKHTVQLFGGYEQRLSHNNTVGSKISTLRYGDALLGANLEFSDPTNAKYYAIAQYAKALKDQTKITVFDADLAQNLNRNYQFVTVDIYRDQDFGSNFSMYNQFMSMSSSDNVPIEQSYIVGGPSAGRAYKVGLLSSNRGMDLNSELRYTMKIKKSFVEEVQPYLFYDVVSFNKTYANSNKSNLQSAGLGLRVRTKYDFLAGVEYGVPFTKNVTVDGIVEKNKNVAYFTLNKSFDF